MDAVLARRHVLIGAAAIAATVPAAAESASASGPSPARGGGHHGEHGPHAHPWDRRHAAHGRLRDGSPSSVRMDHEQLERLPGLLRDGIGFDPQRFSGATAIVARGSTVVHRSTAGWALRWKDDEELLPREEWVEAREDTIWDLASISKLFTATSAMQLVEKGALGLQDRVADHLPRFAENGKGEITVQQLLTHVSGLPAFLNLYSDYDDVPARIDAVLTAELDNPPGQKYVYSDLGLITIGLIIEKLSGQGLDEYVRDHITGPLGMHETMYNPPKELLPRIAATEYQPWMGAGIVRGRVHDENAAALGGVAGHAGVFATAHDLMILARMMLGGGRYGDARILRAETIQDMFTDRIAEVTGAGGERRGLGPELAAWFYHSGLTSPFSGGHTGFTGTSLVMDPLTDTAVVLMTNAVHPTRDWSTTSVTRREVSTAVARSLGLEPSGRGAWHAGDADDTTATLTASLELPARDVRREPARIDAEVLAHLETEADALRFEVSTDDGSTWTPLTGTVRPAHGRQLPPEVPEELPATGMTGWGGREMLTVSAPVVDADGKAVHGELLLRLALTTDAATRGLGAWVERLRVRTDHAPVLDTRRRHDRAEVVAEGWT